MKREDLEERPFCTIIASSDFPFYAAPEADNVMDAMEERIKELEHQVMTDCTCDSSKSATLRMDLYKANERIKELEAENARLKAEIEQENKLIDYWGIEGLLTITENNKELRLENARLKAQVPKWISVKDSLPPKNKEFIGCSIKGSVSPCWLQFPENAIGYLSHWMLLPPPPTEESSATEKENG